MAAKREFRRTKIVCTLGPASSTPEQIEQLAAAGMNVARLNMSHGDHASHLEVIRIVQQLNARLPHPIALLLDLRGPAIRTGDRHGRLSMEVGQEFYITVGPTASPEERTIRVDYPDLVQQLKVGDRITVDNGLINLEVREVREQDLRCRVRDGGVLGSRRHINLPGVRINLPSITEQDVADIRFAAEHDVDFLAVSFVRSAEAVHDARRVAAEAGGRHMRIIAKIENQEGLDNLDAIIDAADGIMVARGDLGVEVEYEMLPAAQRDMVRRCAVAGKPVIVATHLLESMIDNPMPTRAEVTDVANAVYEQADAVMLSGETATGKYPVRCVNVLDRIARRIEQERGLELHRDRKPESVRDQLARSACLLADSLGSPRDCRHDPARPDGAPGQRLSPARRHHLRLHQHRHRPPPAVALAIRGAVHARPDGGAGAGDPQRPRAAQGPRSAGERRTRGDCRQRRHQRGPHQRHPGACHRVSRRPGGPLSPPRTASCAPRGT